MAVGGRQKGAHLEQVAKEFLEGKWWQHIRSNFTMRWWEIDLIFKKPWWEYVFVEVKWVDYIDDVWWYITHKKLKSLQKTIEYFLLKNWLKWQVDYQIDVIFVKNNQILEHLENIFID